MRGVLPIREGRPSPMVLDRCGKEAAGLEWEGSA